MTDIGTLVYNIVANDLTKVGTEAAAGNLTKLGVVAGAAIAGIGAAGILATDANTKFMGSLDAVSQVTGIATDALRTQALAMANGKDSIDEVTATMGTLGKFNVTTADQMQTATEATL